jgi:pSer/pThr/pTyr-binding forkhead associated (FHA) protein
LRRWFPRSKHAEGQGSERGLPLPQGHTTLELLALEGADAGGRFTLDGDEIAVGRGAARTARTGAISLTDATVSPRQAVIRAATEGIEIEHRDGATNPTLVNGRPVNRASLRAGDRIQMGRVLFEVRSRPGIALSGLIRIPEALATTQLSPPAQEPTHTTTTEVRNTALPRVHLTLVRGVPGWEGKRFTLEGMRNTLGRNPNSDILIPEPGVSRAHSEIVWERGDFFIVHRSATNATYVNGEPVEGRRVLEGGETIQLADRVVLRVDIERPESREVPTEPIARDATAPTPARRDASLKARMEEKIRRDQEIERDFGFTGSFLDVDVVDSHGLKVGARLPEHIVVSFERFRAFARGIVEEFAGQVLNSNGDELMCFFEETLQSVRAASAILERLAEFNASQNLLTSAFRVRQGIHTGDSLVDRDQGVAYSPVLDVAGHLQKNAPIDGLLISAETLARLPEDLPFEPVGTLREGISTYRLDGWVA